MIPFFFSLILSVAAAPGPKFIENGSDPNIEPGEQTPVDPGKLYPLASIPAQVALHPKVLSSLTQLFDKADQVTKEIRTNNPQDTVVGPILTAETFARALPTGSEQKFWVFTAGYRKYPKGTTPTAAVPVAYFVSGSYTQHEGKKVFPLQAKPEQNLPFLGTFPIQDGAFALP